MVVNTISITDKSLVEVRLIEVCGTGSVMVSDRHFALKLGATLDITPSLQEGKNSIGFFVNIPSKLLPGKQEWLGRFEINVDRKIAGSYFKQGSNLIGGKTNLVASLEINLSKDVSYPTAIQLINQLQKVQGITDANKADFSQSQPHILFNNGVTIHTWKNYAGVDHVFIADRSRQCVYGGYVGWIHSTYLQDALQTIRDELKEHIEN